MKKIFALPVFLLLCQVCISQTPEEDKRKHKNLLTYLYELQQISGRDSIVHVDSVYSYQVTIPIWWRIREMEPFILAGAFPVVDSIENVLSFKCFKKNKFNGMADFENWVIKEYSIGQSPEWSSNHTVLLKKALTDFKEAGNAFKVQLLWGKGIYDCCYILTETSTAYIWIDFTATSSTYTKNFEKFKEVVSLFKKF